MNVHECLWISCTGLSNTTQRVGKFGDTSTIRSIYVYLAMYFFPDGIQLVDPSAGFDVAGALPCQVIKI